MACMPSFSSQMRDEAHRFGLAHHRNLRSRKFIATQLTEIPGVGPKSAEILLRQFGSVDRLCSAGHDEWVEAVGARRAEAIRLWCEANSSAGAEANSSAGAEAPEHPTTNMIEPDRTAIDYSKNSPT
ncbi:MAG: hypothetical protein EBS53_06530 [Bacteroidetes bacterium]|nr:hypothetical protein [Bacteroidota bacterium]